MCFSFLGFSKSQIVGLLSTRPVDKLLKSVSVILHETTARPTGGRGLMTSRRPRSNDSLLLSCLWSRFIAIIDLSAVLMDVIRTCGSSERTAMRTIHHTMQPPCQCGCHITPVTRPNKKLIKKCLTRTVNAKCVYI